MLIFATLGLGEVIKCMPTNQEKTVWNWKNFINDLTAVNGGEYLNEPMNNLAYNQIKTEDISKKRFSNIDKTVYASGYRSFFDNTPI